MSEYIGIDEIERCGPIGSQSWFRFQLCEPMPRSAWPLIGDLWAAVCNYSRVADLPHSRLVVLGRAPYRITIGAAQLVYVPDAGKPATEVEGMIFLDWGKLMTVPSQIRIAVITEELVHSFMHICDEVLTGQVVRLLLPRRGSSGAASGS